MKRTLLYASVAALVSGALLGCFDAIAPRSPHARGVSLRITPVFEEAGVQGALPSDVDLIRIVLHHPPALDTTLNFPITPGQDSIRIEILITLNNSSGADTVGVTFQAIRSSDNTVLYSGTQDYQVSVGPPASPSPLVATYVGPGQNILSIAISPGAATIRPGDSIAFNSLALDSTGATILGMPILFDSRNTGVVTVNSVGVARGVALGSTYVVLTSGARAAVKDSALVTVSTAAPPAIALSAAAATFLDTAGTTDPVAQTINVTNGGGGVLSGLSLGTIVYGAGATGWLAASLDASTAPTTLTLAAAKGSLAAGTYTATVPVQAAGASNSPQNVTVSFTIVAAVPAIGLSTASVNFVDTLLTTDPAAQTVNITNTALGTLSGLTVGTISYGAGGTGWLAATLGAATAPTTLSLAVAKGSLAVGTYTATVPVQAAGASNSPQNVTVTFQIVAAPLASIIVTPNPVTLAISGTQQFTAVGKDAGGNVVAIAPTWSVVAGGGAITSAGLFTAGMVAGTFANTVTATVGSISGTASVTVSAGALASIIVTPNPVTLAISGTQQFTAVGKDAGGNVVAIAPTWSVVAGGGAITSAGLFTAGMVAGTFANTVTATVGSISGAASVTVATPLVTLTAVPGYQVMLPGDMMTLVATGKDGSGNPVTPFGLSYVSRTPSVATVDAATGLITAVSSGTAVIVAQAPTATGTAADSTLIVIPGNGAAVVGAIGNGRAFDVAKTGDIVTVQVLVDLRRIPGDTLGSYNAELDWNTAALTYVSSAAVAGGFAAPTINPTNAGDGQLRFASANACSPGLPCPPGTYGAFALIEVTFTAAAAGSSPLTLRLTDLSTTTFTQLLSAAVIVSGSTTVH